MTNTIRALLIISTFIFCRYIMKEFWDENWTKTLLTLDKQSYVLLIPARYLFIYSPLLLMATFLIKSVSMFEILGVSSGGFQQYLLAAILCCTPMAIGYAYLHTELNLSLATLITGSIYAGFFEEIIFRAAFFGFLFRYCRWGFIPAASISSIIFGLGHLYQGQDTMSALMAVGITSVAGAWFSWLYCECGYRIWFPLWMHIFMNAAYGIFGMTGGAAGDLEGNLCKATAIILSLVYVNLLIRRGKNREITLASLWKNQSETRPKPVLSSQAA